MCTAILRGMKIIATIPKAVPVVTVARTTIIAAWGISRSIAMVMAAAIRMSMQQSIMMTAAVAMSMSIMLRAQLGTLRMRMMTVAVDTSIIITGMRSMSTTTVAVGTSTITSTHITSPVILMTANASFAILTRSTAMFVAKA